MLTAEATIYRHTKGETLYLTIPAKMAADSAFPFKDGDRVTLKAQGSQLLVVLA